MGISDVYQYIWILRLGYTRNTLYKRRRPSRVPSVMYRLLLMMIEFPTICMLFAVGVWAIPEPIPKEGVAFKLTRADRLGVEVNPASQLSKRQSAPAPGIVGHPSALGDISDDCMPADYLT
jgi:hypothetical protein